MKKIVVRPIYSAVILIIISFLAILAGCASNGPRPANPKTANDYSRHAAYYMAHNEPNEAIASYTRVISMEHNAQLLATNLNHRAFCYQQKNDLAAAEKDYNEALRLCPDEVWIRYNRSRLYALSGQYDKALADCNVVIARHPSWRKIRIFVYTEMDDYGRALTDVNEVIAMARNANEEASFTVWRALIYLKKNDIEHAMADLDHAIDIARSVWARCNSLLKKGEVLEMQGQFDAALEVYEKCIRESQRIEISSSTVVGGVGGGAAGVIQGGAALASPAGLFGMGFVTGVLMVTGPENGGAACRSEATRRIENIKARQQNKTAASGPTSLWRGW